MDSESTGVDDSCHFMMMQTRPVNLQSSHTKRLSKLILKSLFKAYDNEYVPFLVYGSNTLDDWELITYSQAVDGLDMFTTRLLGNYKYFIVVFAAGKNTLIQQIDAVYSERFTETFR